jgi:hypothetical protein
MVVSDTESLLVGAWESIITLVEFALSAKPAPPAHQRWPQPWSHQNPSRPYGASAPAVEPSPRYCWFVLGYHGRDPKLLSLGKLGLQPRPAHDLRGLTAGVSHPHMYGPRGHAEIDSNESSFGLESLAIYARALLPGA